MEEIISKDKSDALMKIKGQIRGTTLKGYKEYILLHQGIDNWNRIYKVLKEYGFPEKIKAMNFYPVGFQVVIIEILKNNFDYNDKKFEELGSFSAKVSLMLRMFAKYFFSSQKMMEYAPLIWNKSYTIGKIKILEFNEKEKYITIRLEDFKIHPCHGGVLVGYFGTLLRMIGGGEAKGQETKSPFRGDDCYEFSFKW